MHVALLQIVAGLVCFCLSSADVPRVTNSVERTWIPQRSSTHVHSKIGDLSLRKGSDDGSLSASTNYASYSGYSASSSTEDRYYKDARTFEMYSSSHPSLDSDYASKVSRVSKRQSSNPRSYSYNNRYVVRTLGPLLYTGTSFLAKGASSTHLPVATTVGDSSPSVGNGYDASFECLENQYRWGTMCRSCLARPTCPIGQYATSCSQSNAPYCTACTNKPTDENYEYVSPGHNNDCEFRKCVGPCLEHKGSARPATAELLILLPIDKFEFALIEDRYLEKVAEVAHVAVGSVQTIDVTTHDTNELITGRRRLALKRASKKATVTGTPDNLRSDPVPETSCHISYTENQFIEVWTEVITTEENLPSLWHRLTEFQLAAAFSSSCIPPPLVEYIQGEEEQGRNIFTLIAFFMIHAVWIGLCCSCLRHRNKSRRSQMIHPEPPQSGAAAILETSSEPAEALRRLAYPARPADAVVGDETTKSAGFALSLEYYRHLAGVLDSEDRLSETQHLGIGGLPELKQKVDTSRTPV